MALDEETISNESVSRRRQFNKFLILALILAIFSLTTTIIVLIVSDHGFPEKETSELLNENSMLQGDSNKELTESEEDYKNYMNIQESDDSDSAITNSPMVEDIPFEEEILEFTGLDHDIPLFNHEFHPNILINFEAPGINMDRYRQADKRRESSTTTMLPTVPNKVIQRVGNSPGLTFQTNFPILDDELNGKISKTISDVYRSVMSSLFGNGTALPGQDQMDDFMPPGNDTSNSPIMDSIQRIVEKNFGSGIFGGFNNTSDLPNSTTTE